VKEEIAVGPGKIDLLEAIGRTGSISAAARDLGLSYRRAWGMVDTMNRCFRKPVITCATGGKGGGGAGLSEFGRALAKLYRTMERKALNAVQPEWKALARLLRLS
jgi:molybdate transport system regulatory protein